MPLPNPAPNPHFDLAFDLAFEACRFGRTLILTECLERAPSINDMANRDGWTLLQMACRHGNVHCARALISQGADPNAPHLGIFYKGWSCAMIALDNRHLDCAQALFEAGADPRALAPDGITGCESIVKRIAGFSDIRPDEALLLDSMTGAFESARVAQSLRDSIPDATPARASPRI
jgi:hypothetical protein